MKDIAVNLISHYQEKISQKGKLFSSEFIKAPFWENSQMRSVWCSPLWIFNDFNVKIMFSNKNIFLTTGYFLLYFIRKPTINIKIPYNFMITVKITPLSLFNKSDLPAYERKVESPTGKLNIHQWWACNKLFKSICFSLLLIQIPMMNKINIVTCIL